MTTLRSARLILRPVRPDDASAFEAFYGDPEVMAIRKYGALSPEAARSQLQEMIGHWKRHGFGIWAVEDRSTGEFSGECGLRWLEDASDVELSYGLYPRHRGRGLATEAARAALDYAVKVHGFGRIVALSRGDNTASHSVLEKIGMTLEWRRRSGQHELVQYVFVSNFHRDPTCGAGVRP